MTPSLRTIYRKRVGVSLCGTPTTDRITNVRRRRIWMTMIRPRSDVVYGICRGLPSVGKPRPIRSSSRRCSLRNLSRVTEWGECMSRLQTEILRIIFTWILTGYWVLLYSVLGVFNNALQNPFNMLGVFCYQEFTTKKKLQNFVYLFFLFVY